MMNRAVARSLGWFFLLACALGGCASAAPKHDAVVKFASATEATAENSKAAFALVAQTGRMAEIETRTNDYLTSAARVKLEPIKPQLTNDILEPRVKVLEALAGYAALLSALTSGDQQAAFDKNAKALGENLKTVKGGNFEIPDGAKDGVTKAVTVLGDFLIQQILDRRLPPVIRRMDDTIASLCDAMVQDIGSPGDATGKGAGGLRQIIANNLKEYRAARVLNLAAIASGPGASSKLELAREYKQAVDDSARVETLDSSLSALQSALVKMKQAHAALVAPDHPSTLQKVEAFAAQAERVGKLADTLRKQ